jgi:hypothetical protein
MRLLMKPPDCLNMIRLLSRRIRELNQDVNRLGSEPRTACLELETRPGQAIWASPGWSLANTRYLQGQDLILKPLHCPR